jgi:protein SCO1/2
MKQRIKRVLTMCVLGVLIGSGIAWFQGHNEARTAAAVTPAAGGEQTATVGGPFRLTNQDGQVVTEKDYPGFKLAFFGFTHCPDVCPTGLQKMTLVMKGLGDDAAHITPIFVTVDPARDTPEVLKDFLHVYDDRFVGLTGTQEDIDNTVHSFRVYAAKQEGADPEHYMINHSGFTYLLDNEGRMLTVFGADEDPQAMVAEIRKYMKAS